MQELIIICRKRKTVQKSINMKIILPGAWQGIRFPITLCQDIIIAVNNRRLACSEIRVFLPINNKISVKY